LENLDQLPDLIFNHNLLTEDGIFILEHPREYQFENHPHFWQHRNYGKVNFTFFANQLSPEE
ncbi:MAG: 16S rRNA (guanine(966)-N(2))-methyltransferase RsmD, partial [Bacteroidales bacterium]|nr:16S rRNA (guanine(966)-N(2))-methyltransferase RsmD [Bacteroidales bacterium]